MSNGDSLHVAVVTPWFGPELTGGAERTAWQVAHGLASRGHRIEVVTTCARAFASDWAAAVYPPGTHEENGLVVRRFPVDARVPSAFNRANEILLGRPLAYYRSGPTAIEADVADDFIGSGINSAAAVKALRTEAATFDAVLVLPYPYGLSLAAIEAAGPRAILQPCLHDEPYAYLPAVENAFRSAGAVLFNTPGERRLAYRLYGPAIALKSILAGQWVDEAPQPVLPSRVRGVKPAELRYALYLGRRDETKNVDLLVESFARFRRHQPIAKLDLVLVGPGLRSFDDPRHGIHDLGHVDESQKAALLAGACAVVQPSLNESFSRAVIEGWRAGKPAIVNARCSATAEAVGESGGGWTAATKAEWSAAFQRLDDMPDPERAAFGARGKRYVMEQTSRENVLERYESAIRALAGRGAFARTRFDVPASPELIRRLSDGRKTILFAGPLVETACIEQLLAAFAYLLSYGVDSRLLLLGEFDSEENLADRFYALIARSHLTERVVILDPARLDVVAASYRSADIFWSTAEDGPTRELIDALGFGVPVLAFANPFAQRILGESGLLFNDKTDPRVLAGIAAVVLTDRSLRETLIDGQRRRFESLRDSGELERAG